MKLLFGDRIYGVGILAIVAAGCIAAASASFTWAQEEKQSDNQSAAAEGIKIKPYTGPPIYLPEAEQVAEPKIVTRDTKTDKYEDGKVRVERQLALRRGCWV